jgi:hypothetical protein
VVTPSAMPATAKKVARFLRKYRRVTTRQYMGCSTAILAKHESPRGG